MRIFCLSLFSLALIITNSSCKKDSNSIDTSPNFFIYNGGASVSANNLLLFSSSDTLTLNLTISSTYSLPKQTTVTFAVTDTSLNNYNNAYGTSFQLMPANAYSFSDTIIMSSGKSVDTLKVAVFKSKLNINGNYMLPITIADAQGEKISNGTQTIFLQYKGNRIGGVYTLIGTRIEYIGDAANNNVADTITLPATKNIIPVDTLSSVADYADLGSNGWQYRMLFDKETGEFVTIPNTVITQSVLEGSFKMLEATYDEETKAIHLRSTYKNSSGDERIVDETFTPQQ